jgi:hypothetical protein
MVSFIVLFIHILHLSLIITIDIFRLRNKYEVIANYKKLDKFSQFAERT